MSDCIFCAIARGEAPAQVVCEWADALAIVPLNPVTDGHLLVIPRDHASDAGENPDATAAVMRHAATLSRVYPASNIITSIGAEATQTVFHLHVHVVPRLDGDGLHLPWTVAA